MCKTKLSRYAGQGYLRTSFEVHKEQYYSQGWYPIPSTLNGLPEDTFDYGSTTYGSTWGGHVGLKESSNNESGYIHR